MSELISFGGGVNSIAMIILLVNEGWRGPIVFADTGAEWPETYCYMDYFEAEFLHGHGLQITKLLFGQTGSSYRSSYYNISLEQKCLELGKIPTVFFRWCTSNYKIRPIGKWQKAHDIQEQLLGIAAEEAHRAKGDKKYPLIEKGIDREECKEIIKNAGLEIPPKSSCFFCPFQKKYRWRDLFIIHPDLFERAATLERNASKKNKYYATLEPSGKYTLDDLRESFERQVELPAFEYESLREFQGCVCGL